MARAQDLADRVKAAEIDADEAAAAADVLWRGVSNLVDPTSPVGGEEDFVVLEHVGTPRDFSTEGFEPKDHLELGEALGAIDVERGAKVSGSRFFYLTGPGAELEFALLGLAMQHARSNGLVPVITRRSYYRAQWTEPVFSVKPPSMCIASNPMISTSWVPARFLSRCTRTRSSRRRSCPPVCRLVELLRREAGSQEGHPRDHPRAPVRQGRNVRLLRPCRC